VLPAGSNEAIFRSSTSTTRGGATALSRDLRVLNKSSSRCDGNHGLSHFQMPMLWNWKRKSMLHLVIWLCNLLTHAGTSIGTLQSYVEPTSCQ